MVRIEIIIIFLTHVSPRKKNFILGGINGSKIMRKLLISDNDLFNRETSWLAIFGYVEGFVFRIYTCIDTNLIIFHRLYFGEMVNDF